MIKYIISNVSIYVNEYVIFIFIFICIIFCKIDMMFCYLVNLKKFEKVIMIEFYVIIINEVNI